MSCKARKLVIQQPKLADTCRRAASSLTSDFQFMSRPLQLAPLSSSLCKFAAQRICCIILTDDELANSLLGELYLPVQMWRERERGDVLQFLGVHANFSPSLGFWDSMNIPSVSVLIMFFEFWTDKKNCKHADVISNVLQSWSYQVDPLMRLQVG